MALSYSSQVDKSIKYMLNRLGSTVTYKRLQAPGEWNPDPSKVIDILWEWPTFKAIIYDVKTSDVEESGGRLELGDKAFAFLSDVFTSHTNEEYIKFTAGATEFMVGELLTGATSGETANVVSSYEDSGTWAAGTAVGVVWVSGASGEFGASEIINGSVGGTNMATTTKTNTSGGTDSAAPESGDKIVYGGDTYKVDLAATGGGTIIREDITGITSTIWARVIENG